MDCLAQTSATPESDQSPTTKPAMEILKVTPGAPILQPGSRTDIMVDIRVNRTIARLLAQGKDIPSCQ
jgi:hypothetical protein